MNAEIKIILNAEEPLAEELDRISEGLSDALSELGLGTNTEDVEAPVRSMLVVMPLPDDIESVDEWIQVHKERAFIMRVPGLREDA